MDGFINEKFKKINYVWWFPRFVLKKWIGIKRIIGTEKEILKWFFKILCQTIFYISITVEHKIPITLDNHYHGKN